MATSVTAGPGNFEFWKVAYLVEVTPLRAVSLSQLLTGVTLTSQWSLFFHLHQRFFRDPERLPDYPNDFAAWAHDALGEDVTAERLANLNLIRSVDLEVVRREISIILAESLLQGAEERRVSSRNGFVFCKPRVVAFPSGQVVQTPPEFSRALRGIDHDSIAYHLFFAPRIAPAQVANDFTVWFRNWGHADLAQQFDAFDPYLNSLEDNRNALVRIIDADFEAEEAPP